MLLIVYCLLFNVVAGIPLAKLSSSTIPLSGTKDLLSQIMLFKDNDEALLSVLSDADPAKLNEVITLLKALLTTSEAELLGLTTSSGNADTAFTDAVAAHNAAKVALANGLGPLATTRDNAIAAANSVYNQGVVALQNAVDDAKGVVDSTNSTKRTANSVLALDQTRLNSEINTLKTVITLMEGLLGINTISPTSSPTTTAPTSSPTVTAVVAGFRLEHECTAGNWYGTYYGGLNSIEDCENICRNESGCTGFTYGNTYGFRGHVGSHTYVSNGARANACHMIHNPSQFVTGGESKCVWNTYSLA